MERLDCCGSHLARWSSPWLDCRGSGCRDLVLAGATRVELDVRAYDQARLGSFSATEGAGRARSAASVRIEIW
jgi:hypothetical protein